MTDKLTEIISAYEDEKQKLHGFIINCIKEEDFLLAHYHQEALYHLNHRIDTLKRFDDPLYPQKAHKEFIIQNLEKSLQSDDNTYDFIKDERHKKILRDSRIKHLQKLKEELEQLNGIPKQTTSCPTELSSYVDSALNNLLNKVIGSFQIILKQEDNLRLEFATVRNGLKIVLPCIKQLNKKWIINGEETDALCKLGFALGKNNSKLMVVLKGKKEDLVIKVRFILAVIVFDIFSSIGFESGSLIKTKKLKE